uniref:Uncharacterized protein n=1 Tax=Nelumbo nucifera TaxID=4432 RepID=A0A822YY71_NELNU|nr:TPA_asm: hypothetical protein HUJ06_008253 [Nelumbo nucifera]
MDVFLNNICTVTHAMNWMHGLKKYVETIEGSLAKVELETTKAATKVEKEEAWKMKNHVYHLKGKLSRMKKLLDEVEVRTFQAMNKRQILRMFSKVAEIIVGFYTFDHEESALQTKRNEVEARTSEAIDLAIESRWSGVVDSPP